MKLISVQSRGDRLVKVWEVDYISYQVSWRQIEAGLSEFVFMDFRNCQTLKSALDTASEWLEGATV